MRESLPRRSVLKSVATVPAAWSLLSQSMRSARAASGSDWPEFQYDAANTGYNPDAEGPTGELVERWSFETLGEVVSSPIVVDDTVYVGSKDGKVYALDAETGEKEWEYDTGTGIRSSPVSDGTTLYIGNQDGTVFALSIDGIEEWTADFDGPVSDALSAVDGRLFVPVSEVNSLVAIETPSGIEEWRSDWESYAFHAKPAVADGVVYSVDNAEPYEMRARNSTDGEYLFSYGIGNLHNQLSYTNNSVYIIDAYDIFSINSIENTPRWAYDFQDLSYVEKTSVAVRSRTLYVAARTDSSGYLMSFDTVTGDREWRVELSSSTVSSLVLAGDLIYVGCDDGNVYSLNQSDGSEVSSFETDAAVRSTAAVSGGAIFIGSDDGYVYAIENLPPNEGPTAAFSYSPSPVVAGREVEFDASESTDSDGSIESYEWDFTGNGATSATGKTAATTFEGSGEQEVTLSVTDDRGATDSTSQTVEINQAPEPAFSHSPTVPNASESVTFDASGSSDSDGSIEQFEWDFNDDGQSEVTGEQVSHTFTETGDHLVTLTITDTDGTSESISQTVSVNKKPTAAFTVTPEQPGVGQTVTFDASESSDSDGAIQAYEWNFGDDDSTDATGETTTTQYDELGEQTVSLTVTDDNGVSDSTQLTFIVVEEPADPLSDQSGDGEDDSQTDDSQTDDSQTDDSTTSDSSADPSGDTAGNSDDDLPVGPVPILGALAGGATLLGGRALLARRNSDDSGIETAIDELLDHAKASLNNAEQSYQVGEYDRALALCEQAIDAAERARETAREDAPHRVADAEAILNEVREFRDSTQAERDNHQQSPDTPIGDDDRSDAAVAAESRREDFMQKIRDTLPQVPTTIPTTPQLSLSYEALEKRERIGSGGNADVHYDTTTAGGETIDLAIKEPRVDGTLDTSTVQRTMEEAKTWQQLDDHDHIVSVLDYGSEPLPWIAMEYMDGGHLGQRVGRLEFEQAVWTAMATTTAVRHAHRRGVAHLDLKPENILFRSVEDAWDVPKVADWGLSKHLLRHSKSVEGVTPHYAAPEQFDEAYGSADDITDVYQLGTVFYELFTGRPPFKGRPTQVMRAVMDDDPTPPSEYADVPERLDEILLTALEKERTDRYETVVHLRNDLQDLLDAS